MNIGIVCEPSRVEQRVGLTPAAAHRLFGAGHRVHVEACAGLLARFSDEEYRKAGAWILETRAEIFSRSDLVVMVAPLRAADLPLVRPGQAILAFHHLAAADRELVEELRRREATVIGYEVLEDPRGDLPVLHAMSEIAGQLAVLEAAHFLATRAGGRGVLMGGATGIPPAHVVVLGAGTVGLWAARAALGHGAQVSILDADLASLRRVEEVLGRGVVTEVAGPRALGRACAYADVLIGCVHRRGERTPRLVTREMVESMKNGAVIVDVAIDQGGCVETSRPTTLEAPVYLECGVTHYAVPNMTSAVARTASQALSHALLPFVSGLADFGVEQALREERGLAAGAYLYRGDLVSEPVATAFSMGCESLPDLIGVTDGREWRETG